MADHQDGEREQGCPEPADLVQVERVGDDDPGAAVLQEVGQFGVGGARIERDSDRAGAGDRVVALDRLHPVSEQHGRPVAGTQPQVREMSGQSP
ncbi:tecR [Streptomyces filamentosus NRRL 15998]|uniref:TecR n=1 Tax=Streptomyces filamentosus NRRL 15998 TaxID=457431 RepID=D6AIT6_STRFL|nr:tecR [Streptomyces filamentosus NRRL 15998]